ncbi:MAG: HesA/MoeB/ThiF family protein [Cellvibrionaceae bacterium]|nr:HesA/MoeB/ThiF family protein [Cellvibrionaceae bacterium]
MNKLTFTAQEWLRYTRHIQLKGFGASAQAKLKRSRVLVVGLGGLGCPVAAYLAAAGVGHLTLVDGDTVDATNLQRQILYTGRDIDEYKAEIAREKLTQLNADIVIDAHCSHFSLSLASQLGEFDLLVDCTDNFASRYLINDFCLRENLTWLYASVNHFSGQCALFEAGEACFRCLFPETPQHIEDCNAAGVIGTVPAMLGVIQANEAIAFLSGRDAALKNKLLILDVSRLDSRKISLVADPSCRCRNSSITIDSQSPDYQFACEDGLSAAGSPSAALSLAPEAFARECHREGVMVVDVRSEQERELFHIGGDHLPIDKFDQALDNLDREQTIICYCQTGKRSLAFAEKLSRHGFNAKSLSGGLVAMLKMSFKKG